MTDRGMGAMADVAAHHPSLENLNVASKACTVCLTDMWNAEMRESDSCGVMLVVSVWLPHDGLQTTRTSRTQPRP